MPSFDVEINETVKVEFEVYCSCGAQLCNQSTGKNNNRRNTPQVIVEPCENCKRTRYEAGYDKGYSDGNEDAQKVYRS